MAFRMSNLGPLNIVFRDGQRLSVSSLKDVSVALNRQGWPDADSEIATLRQLTEDAIAGRLAPRVAFDAFALKAHRCGMVEPRPKSAAWEDFSAAFRSPR